MRRIAVIAVVIALMVGALPGTALAWCNGGPKNGIVGNGYGTHDWILDRAIKQAGADGAWVNRTSALLSTDNPDSQRTHYAYHWFREVGPGRGAPFMVSELYHKAVVAYRAGDKVSASKYLGVLSHYYADIIQPFHTSSTSDSYRKLHSDYEFAVDDYQHKPTGVAAWVTPRPVAPVTDIRAKTVSAALYARSLFPGLLASYKLSHSVRTGRTYTVTKLVMSRAVNDLADIVASIPLASGETSAPATVSMHLSRTNPRQNTGVTAYVTCTDSEGMPMDAVGVLFTWRLPTGTTTTRTFTDASGLATRGMDIGMSPIGQRSIVSANVTVNGTTTVVESWFVPTR